MEINRIDHGDRCHRNGSRVHIGGIGIFSGGGDARNLEPPIQQTSTQRTKPLANAGVFGVVNSCVHGRLWIARTTIVQEEKEGKGKEERGRR